MAKVLRRVVVLCGLLALAACGGSNPNLPAAGSVDADKFLFDHGTASLQRRRWIEAREYFRTLIDTYPQSTYRQEAKLGIGDTYLGEDSVESNILAVNEFREFLSFFPGNPRTDYAQYRLAVGHEQQMLGPDRDLTPARDTLAAAETFLANYPTSDLRPQVQAIRRKALDELSEGDYKVGLYYYRMKWHPGAIERFKGILLQDPEYPARDGVYFYLAEMYHSNDQNVEARPYYDRIVREFEKSEFLERARRRLEEIGPAGGAENGNVRR